MTLTLNFVEAPRAGRDLVRLSGNTLDVHRVLHLAAGIAEAPALGISGVPFFVADRRYGSPAQPADVPLGMLRQAWASAHPIVMAGGGDDASCIDAACAV